VTGEALVMGLAIFLIAEGLLPLVAPRTLREVFARVLQFNDGQVRFFGLVFVGLGLLMLWL
jgi:uncharacterized protein YjeT (DUF2065 family)